MKTKNINIFFKNSWVAWIIFFTSLIITFLIWNQVKNNITDKAEVVFKANVDEVKFSIQKRMKSYEQVLMGGVALFKVKENLSRSDFHTYVENLRIEQNFPGIQGIGFSKVIRPHELQGHISKVREEGYPHYKVWPEGRRDLYTSIIYLEPFKDRNLRAFGYDMFSEPIRNHAMTKAMELGVPYASGKVILVQETETDVQKGFLVYVPVYYNNVNTSTVKARKEAIFGFVYSPFRMKDLMKGIIGNKPSSTSIEIFDGQSTDPVNLLYSSSKAPRDNKTLFSYTSPVSNDNRTWTIHFASTQTFEDGLDYQKSWIVLISGFLISILLFISAFSFERTKEVYENLEEILEAAGEGIYGLDQEGKCTFINDAALAMIGYEKEECLGKRIHDIIHCKKADGTPYPYEECWTFIALTQLKKVEAVNEVFWRKNGSRFFVDFTANPIFEKGKAKGTVVAFNDVTFRKQNEEKLNASLSEKEVLLKEIHHRVKNNMQVVSSLLNLQYQYLQNADDETVKAFQESQNRIRSMALIHEKLYQTKDLTHISFGDYVRDLVAKLYNSYKYTSGGVYIDIKTESIDLNMDISISLGLVINELVSNAFKHAFVGRSNNCLTVTMVRHSDVYELTIADNGKGFDCKIDFRETDSLGLQLVNTLVAQVDGSIDLEVNNGTKFIIKFPV